MKFVELFNGDFLNIEHITKVYLNNDGAYLRSFLTTINEKEEEFLDLPQLFEDFEGNSHTFEEDHLISLHRHALKILARDDFLVMHNQDLTDKAWMCFAEEYDELIRNLRNKV